MPRQDRSNDWFPRAQINAFRQIARMMFNGVGSLLVDLGTATTVTVSSITTQPGILPTTSSGFGTLYHLISAATTNATSVKASAGVVGSITATNGSAAIKFLKLYNKASAPTVGTDTPVMTIGVPAGNTVVIENPAGIRFSTGIALATTGLITVADTTAVALSDLAISLAYV